MKFLIATAALFCALVIATPARLPNRNYTPSGCRIIGDCPIPVRECPSEFCAETGYFFYPDQYVDFDCYVVSDSVDNDVNGITSYYWDVNGAGFFPEAYVDPECAATIDQLCQ